MWKKMSKSQRIKAFLSKHFLPIGTLFIIPFGIFFPIPAVYLNSKLPVVQMCIVTLFFIIGTKFRLEEIRSALRCYKETALGIVLVLLVTPVVGTKLLLLPRFVRTGLHKGNGTLNSSWTIQLPDLGPEEFRIGLQIFCVSPCASAFPTVVVTEANGDRALTLLIAIIATVISVFTVPVMTTWLIPAFQTASVSFLTILPGVVLYILLPLIVGRLLRFIKWVKDIVQKLNTYLKFVTSGALLVMFWVKISQATAKGDLRKFSPWMIVAVTALGTAVITSFLVMSFIFASLLRLSKKSILSVTVLSSARHSSIAIAVIENIPENVGDKDLMFFPIIFVYLTMVVIINSFGAFMTIEKEEADIDILEEKPLNNNDEVKEIDKRKKNNIVLLLEPLETKLIRSREKISSVSNKDVVTLPLIQRQTVV